MNNEDRRSENFKFNEQVRGRGEAILVVLRALRQITPLIHPQHDALRIAAIEYRTQRVSVADGNIGGIDAQRQEYRSAEQGAEL